MAQPVRTTVTTPEGEKIGSWITDAEGNHVPDPFADEPELADEATAKHGQITINLPPAPKKENRMATKSAERGTYVQETLPNAVEPAISGEVMPYTRVADLAPSLELQNLEEIQGEDLILWGFNKYHSSENDADFLTIEASFLGNPEQRFLVNCGGQAAMEKIENAFAAVERKEARGPLVAAFRKIPTSNGRTFWTVS